MSFKFVDKIVIFETIFFCDKEKLYPVFFTVLAVLLGKIISVVSGMVHTSSRLGHCVTPCQILRQSVEPLLRYCDLAVIIMAAVCWYRVKRINVHQLDKFFCYRSNHC